MSVAMVCDWACLNKTVSDYNKPGDWWKVAVGLFGEASFGSIHGIFPDFSKKGKGDGGIDFRINGVTYDVKCTETKKEVLLVRVVNEDGEYVPLSADQYVGTKMVSFDEDARIAVVQIMGTASRKWLEALPETPGLPKNAKCIGLEFIDAINPPNIWINDFDVGIAALWTSVGRFPDQLVTKIHEFQPSVQAFYDAKDFFLQLTKSLTQLTEDETIQCGFNKLILHQLSYSGLGMKSGGPLGGREQDATTKYPIDCRWSPTTMVKKIMKLHDRFICKDMKITNVDFADLITDTSRRALLYLDPPYYEKGGELYYHHFNDEDHIRLADMLKTTEHDWILSYDSCDFIRKLYSWATIEEINANYTINTSTKKTEFIIYKGVLPTILDF
ncbi:unnamed protein product [Sphagnum tenellum]